MTFSLRHTLLVIGLCPAAALAQQSFLSKVLHGAANNVASAVTNTGTHASGQAASNFAPDMLDGYTHLRFGASAQDPYGNTVASRPTCDREFVGYGLLHRNALLAQDESRCLSLEQALTPGSTPGTVQSRLAALSGARKFYTRGTIRVYTNSGPAGEAIPPGKVLLAFGGDGAQPVLGPADADLLFTGKNWFGPWSGPGNFANVWKISTSLDPSQRMRWVNMAQSATVFYTVGDPVDAGPSTWQRGHRMYRVPVTVDRIVLQDAQGQSEITPDKN